MISLNNLNEFVINRNLQLVAKSELGFVDTDCEFIYNDVASILNVSKGYLSYSNNDNRLEKINSLIDKVVYGK